MSERRDGLSRRGFFKVGAGAAAAGLVAGPAEAEPEPEVVEKARVVLVRDERAVNADGEVDGAVVRRMLADGMRTLFEVETAEAAWRRVVRPGDVVGIKSNVWGRLPTPPSLEEAIRDGLVGAGVAAADIAVDDRGVRRNPVFTRATAMVNVRPLRTHHWSGLGTLVKNMIMFVERPADYHGDACATLGAIWRLPEVEGKVRLNILVMLTPQFHGLGPHSFSKEFVWTYGGLLLGLQPAPVDAVGARIIEARRREYFGEERPISPSPHHIEIAGERYGLGPTAPEHIDLVRLGWSEAALV